MQRKIAAKKIAAARQNMAAIGLNETGGQQIMRSAIDQSKQRALGDAAAAPPIEADQPEIHRELSRLQQNISYLENTIVELGERLHGVLHPEPPADLSGESPAEEEPNTNIGMCVRDQRLRVNVQLGALHRVIKRLAI